MEHTFTLSRSDFLSFQKEVGKVIRKAVPRSWGFLLQLIVWLCVGLTVSTYLRLYESAYEYRRPLAIVGGLVLLATVMFLIARAVAGRMVQKHFLRDNGSLLSPQTITLNEDGVSLTTLQGLGSSRFAWAAFIGRTEDERNVYLFIEPSYGIIIPKEVIVGAGHEVVRQRVREL